MNLNLLSKNSIEIMNFLKMERIMVVDIEEKSKIEQVYRLNWNTDHIYDVEFDAWLREFPNAPSNLAFAELEELNLPQKIEFDAIGEVLEVIDYPYTDVMWTIMSKRMLDVLLSVGNFRHKAYPVVMIDCEQIYNEELDIKSISGIEYHNFYAVHVLEYLDVFDWEKSIYEKSKKNSNVLKNIEKVALKEPPKGFPPLFRVAAPPIDVRLYISSEARIALELANIRGVNFLQVENNYEIVGALP
jgi:hypothetical protein